MSYPISELIVRNVVDVVSTVTYLSGYDSEMKVVRVIQRPDPIEDGTCVIGAGDPLPQPNPPLGFDEFLLPVGITVFAMGDENSTEAIDSRLYTIASDIRKALRQDVHRGGYAVNTEFDGKDDLVVLNSPPAIVIYPNVRFRTLYNDPYSQA